MAIRQVGGAQGEPLVVACAVASTHQDVIAVGGIVEFSTGANWTVNSTAHTTHTLNLGRVIALNENSSVATIELFGYNKAFEAQVSGTCGLGSTVVAAGTLNCAYVKSSGGASSSLKLSRCVAADYPASGYCQWVSV